MKRILLGTMAALGSMTGLSALEGRLLGHQGYRNNDPRAARHWHNPTDPVQAARIEAAAAKRERKARIANRNAHVMAHYNYAHHVHPWSVGDAFGGFQIPHNLLPTYIAK